MVWNDSEDSTRPPAAKYLRHISTVSKWRLPMEESASPPKIHPGPAERQLIIIALRKELAGRADGELKQREPSLHKVYGRFAFNSIDESKCVSEAPYSETRGLSQDEHPISSLICLHVIKNDDFY
jgi:hypothetical protein